jgi:hypothetical protein
MPAGFLARRACEPGWMRSGQVEAEMPRWCGGSVSSASVPSWWWAVRAEVDAMKDAMQQERRTMQSEGREVGSPFKVPAGRPSRFHSAIAVPPRPGDHLPMLTETRRRRRCVSGPDRHPRRGERARRAGRAELGSSGGRGFSSISEPVRATQLAGSRSFSFLISHHSFFFGDAT